MSTISKPRRRPPKSKIDPYPLGWRDVWQKDTNGRRQLVMVPLTVEDILHPQEGDHIANNDEHAEDVTYLRGVFQSILAAVAGALVLTDVPIYWDDRTLRHHSPDVSVIFGTRRRRRWPSFYVAREGVRPKLLLEVTSQSTRGTDLVTKRLQYYRAGVEYYVIVDELPQRRKEGPRQLRILGYRRGQRGYERLKLNEQGRLWLEPVGVWLGVEDGRVVCYDRDGRRLGTYVEVTQALDAAEERVFRRSPLSRRRQGARRGRGSRSRCCRGTRCGRGPCPCRRRGARRGRGPRPRCCRGACPPT